METPKDLAEALQETPAVQFGGAVAEATDTVECSPEDSKDLHTDAAYGSVNTPTSAGSQSRAFESIGGKRP